MEELARKRGREGHPERHMSTPVLERFADWGCSQVRPRLGSPLSPSLCSISVSVLSPGTLDLRHRKRGAASTHLSAHTLSTSSVGQSLSLSRPVLLLHPPQPPSPQARKSASPSLPLTSCTFHRPCPTSLCDLFHLSPILPLVQQPLPHSAAPPASSHCLRFTPAN